jgi:leader peptidase (prepilin peptidase) / N-methyltransferase
MAALFVLIGLVVAWLLNTASDYLPRFAGIQPTSSSILRLPAVIGFLGKRRSDQPWLRLHLAVELLTGTFFAWLGIHPVSPTDTILLAAGFSLFTLIAVIDVKYRLVLNVVTYPAMLAILIVQVVVLRHDFRSVIVGGVLAFAVFYMVARLKPGQLGGGDVKLAALIGLTFGFPHVLWALLVGAGVGGVAALILLSRQVGLQYRIPYAPFLCLGAMVILMYYSLQMAL